MANLLDILNEIRIKPAGEFSGRPPDYETRLRINQYIQNGSKGDLDLSNTNIRTLGFLKKVRGNLNLNNCRDLKSLGDLRYVTQGLYARNCTNLTTLGRLQEIGGMGDFENCTALVSLGNLERVRWDFDLTDCESLESLGNLKFVGDRLYIIGTPIAQNYSEREVREQVWVERQILKDRF